MSTSPLPSDYSRFLSDIKTRVRQAQLKALMAVNTELITLYWHIGKQIVERQQQQGWGAGVIEQLSRDLHSAFPEMRGFSPRNLGYMKSFALAYPDEAILQTVSAKLTWSHNTLLLDKVKDSEERLWYMQKAAEHGWSHIILAMQIETRLYHRQGKALTNFKATLPALDSDLASEVLKDPYVFNFLTTDDDNKERHLQNALIAHIQRFLLELGTGFTFVGSNYHLKVGNEDFYIDLLFYHIDLRCYVVIELKAGAFKPEYAGQINFYLTAINRQVKRPDDSPTIGLVLCKTKNTVTAEYALSNINNPVGVASYQHTTSLPEPLQSQLPGIKELEESLEAIRAENNQL